MTKWGGLAMTRGNGPAMTKAVWPCDEGKVGLLVGASLLAGDGAHNQSLARAPKSVIRRAQLAQCYDCPNRNIFNVKD